MSRSTSRWHCVRRGRYIALPIYAFSMACSKSMLIFWFRPRLSGLRGRSRFARANQSTTSS